MTAPGNARPPPAGRAADDPNLMPTESRSTVITLKGTTSEFIVPGDRAHRFDLPLDRDLLYPKVLKAFAIAEAAGDAYRKATQEKPNDRAGQAEAAAQVKAAVHGLYDQAGASAKATRELASEQYEMATRQYARAIEAAQAALQTVASAAQVYDQAAGGHAVGINPASRARAVLAAHVLSEQIEVLPGLPAIDA